MKLSTKKEKQKIEQIAMRWKYENNRNIAREAAKEMADYKNEQMEKRMSIIFKCLMEGTILSKLTLQKLKREMVAEINDQENK